MKHMVFGRGTRFVAMLVVPGHRMRIAAIAWFMRLNYRRRRRTAHVAENAGRRHRAPEREQQGEHQKEARSGLHAEQASMLAAPRQRDAKLRVTANRGGNMVAIIEWGAAHHGSRPCRHTRRIARLHALAWTGRRGSQLQEVADRARGFSTDAAGASGSSAIPQMGQLPGPG